MNKYNLTDLVSVIFTHYSAVLFVYAKYTACSHKLLAFLQLISTCTRVLLNHVPCSGHALLLALLIASISLAQDLGA